jgi:hypothetical protein
MTEVRYTLGGQPTDDPIADLIARERHAREEMARHARRRAEWAKDRRLYLNVLHEELGTWKKVADATGQKLPTVAKAASQPRKKRA